MTDTTLTTIGIIVDTIAVLCMLSIPVLNWIDKKQISIEFQKKVIWLYVGKKITKSISWNYCPKWEKPAYFISNNGARKGVKEDTCYDLNIHFWYFVLSYTNYSYNRKLNKPKSGLFKMGNGRTVNDKN